MSVKRKVILVSLLLLSGFLIWFLLLPTFSFSAARKKFLVGTSLEQVQRIAKPPFEMLYPAYPVSPDWEAGEMPEAAKQTTVVLSMHCPKESVLLHFNSYSNLVDIQPVNNPIDSMIWLRSKR